MTIIPPARSNAAEPSGKKQALLEICLVFLVFFLQGAWPVPDFNEPHYLTKTAHYWNPSYISNDFFLDSADTHTVFYFTFGWLTMLLPLPVVAWVGRLLTWGLLAWAWRRLSLAVVPFRWWSIFTAALFLCLLELCHMAGEWVAGGIEAKAFAYVFVFLGLSFLVRNRWNPTWLCFGAAALFHVLVGGWSVIAAAIAWIAMGRPRAKLSSMWPGLLIGGLLSLPALIPSLRLTSGIEEHIVSEANQIYVFLRLPHHLDPSSLPAWFIARFVLLCLLWLVIWMATRYIATRPPSEEQSLNFACGHRLHSFVAGALTIWIIGILISLWGRNDPQWAAGLLRFYWFRLADVAVPMGVALGGASLIALALAKRPSVGRRWLVLASMILAVHFGCLAVLRATPMPPRADRLAEYSCWRRACEWIANPRNIPPESIFLTPRMSLTFKWYTGHGEVVTYKDIPQDAASIVEWQRRIQDIHKNPQAGPLESPWYLTLAAQGKQRLQMLGEKYGADYAITVAAPRLDLPVAYENRAYVVYRLARQRELY